jgi:Flp pilus assembly pilin Flp
MSTLFAKIHLFISNLRSDERGQDLIEYAMLGGLIAATLVGLAVLAAYSDALQAMAGGIGNCIDFDGGTVCNPF